MSQTTETTPSAPEQKPSGAGSPNAPTDTIAAPGRAITAAASQQIESVTTVQQQTEQVAAVPQQAERIAAPSQNIEPVAVVPQRTGVATALDDTLALQAGPAPSLGALAAEAALAYQPTPATTLEAATPPQARATGLTILAEARWPESALDHVPPSLAGFIISSFSPVAAETAARCLSRRPTDAKPCVTAVLIATTRGDRQSADHVAQTVAASGLLGPLLFFQSVPNAVAGHIATRWNLTGPVVCLADPASALETAALLIEDGDADQALLLRVEQNTPDQSQPQHQNQAQNQPRSHSETHAHAVLLAALTPGARP